MDSTVEFLTDASVGGRRCNRVLDLRDNAPIQLAYCWAHARRKLFDLTHHNVAPIAEEGLKQIAALYRIEAQARGTSAEDRLAIRQTKSAPKIATFKTWLDHARIPTMPCSDNLASVQLVFLPGVFLLTYLVAKHNQLGSKDAVLAGFGAKKFQRTLLINFVQATTLLGSLGFSVWIIQTCPS